MIAAVAMTEESPQSPASAANAASDVPKYLQAARDKLRIVREWATFTVWRERLKPMLKSPNFWTALATVVIAVATGVYTYYARKQWQAMSGQLTAMQGQLTEMQKQYPELKKSSDAAISQATLARQELEGTMGAVLTVNGNIHETGEGGLDSFPHAGIDLVNNGHLLASDVQVHAEIEYAALPDMRQIGKRISWNFSVKPLVPQSGYPAQYEHALEISPKFLDLMYDTERTIILHISVAYFDGFEQREDRSCWAFLGGRTRIKKTVMERTVLPCENMANALRGLQWNRDHAYANQ